MSNDKPMHAPHKRTDDRTRERHANEPYFLGIAACGKGIVCITDDTEAVTCDTCQALVGDPRPEVGPGKTVMR